MSASAGAGSKLDATVMPAPPGSVRRMLLVAGFVAVSALLISVVVLTPLAVFSLFQEVPNKTTSRDAHSLTPVDTTPAATHARLHVDIVKFDEVQHFATLRVSGNHICGVPCVYEDRITFYSIPGEGSLVKEGMPPGESITLPPTPDLITTQIQLPFDGNIMTYPFDRYRIILGVTMQRVLLDQTLVTLTPEEASGHLIISLDEQLPRVKVLSDRLDDPRTVRAPVTGFAYLYVSTVDFVRPAYLQVVVVLLVILIGAVAAYAVMLRPFHELIMNAGGMVLGVWGLRSLLLGAYPPDVTVVDTCLMGIVFFLLCTITVRALDHIHGRAGLHILPWATAKPAANAAAPDKPTSGATSRAGANALA